ncbi:MAG: bifunctional 5,10-methylenetetrahydrofolate dehydrogenase/5,10-methenyltetrahydrofolate cyclohydrolase [Clostridia bacterium]|nr:bifunctional 5,10-methylenetetrahydrofolate dehydrogenase/5,10-methenyltetrahydrofolate cyclohydrolase [Clostridia bacterium]MDD4386786.1 bifunctional 5,10-methylenetetrahydrofolate dehydrogenase/5,10-methenyltetrahydrofolate cyclohydrolase [Clostridia bacterium]
MIIDVKNIVKERKQKLKEKIEYLKKDGIIPKLVVIFASDDPASEIYVSKKRNMCKEIGIEEEEFLLDLNITTDKIISIINKLNEDSSIDGILVQLPLYKHLDENKILESINPDKDVDGLHPLNLGKLFSNKKGLVSCTPRGIMTILDELGINISGKNAVIVGRSVLVGKPIAHLLLNKGATITLCHTKTTNLKEHTIKADILVVAVGKAKIITADMVKEGSVVIDVGINRIEDKIIGDVDTENVKDIAKYITPVPGGVGLTTVLSLLENVTEVASNKLN